MTTGQVAPTHDRASCTDGKGNLSQAIPDTTTEITNQRIHTKTLSGERAVRVLPPSPEKFKNIPKMRISLFELVLCPSLNFIRQMEINVLKSKLEGVREGNKGIEGTRPERREGCLLNERLFLVAKRQ